MAGGAAVRYNKKTEGPRSYYPLFFTLAQNAQVLAVWHRRGNVHDSNSARDFILACINEIQRDFPRVILKVPKESVFFSEEIIRALDALRIHCTISAPLERLTQLKPKIEKRLMWRRAERDVTFSTC